MFAGMGGLGGFGMMAPPLGIGGEIVKTVGKMIGEATAGTPGAGAVGGAVGAAIGDIMGGGAGSVGGLVGSLFGGLGLPKLTKLEFNDGATVYSTSPLVFESMERITLRVGPNSIELTPFGIAINGVLVRIN